VTRVASLELRHPPPQRNHLPVRPHELLMLDTLNPRSGFQLPELVPQGVDLDRRPVLVRDLALLGTLGPLGHGGELLLKFTHPVSERQRLGMAGTPPGLVEQSIDARDTTSSAVAPGEFRPHGRPRGTTRSTFDVVDHDPNLRITDPHGMSLPESGKETETTPDDVHCFLGIDCQHTRREI
jgi:hypothetical protein